MANNLANKSGNLRGLLLAEESFESELETIDSLDTPGPSTSNPFDAATSPFRPGIHSTPLHA